MRFGYRLSPWAATGVLCNSDYCRITQSFYLNLNCTVCLWLPKYLVLSNDMLIGVDVAATTKPSFCWLKITPLSVICKYGPFQRTLFLFSFLTLSNWQQLPAQSNLRVGKSLTNNGMLQYRQRTHRPLTHGPDPARSSRWEALGARQREMTHINFSKSPISQNGPFFACIFSLYFLQYICFEFQKRKIKIK